MQQNFNGRNDYVHIVDHSRVRVGKNLLMNRLSLINDSINYERLNLLKDTYKIKCKEKFLSWNAVLKLNWILITMECGWIFLKSKFSSNEINFLKKMKIQIVYSHNQHCWWVQWSTWFLFFHLQQKFRSIFSKCCHQWILYLKKSKDFLTQHCYN